MSVTGPQDGWHFIPNEEEYHYIWKSFPLCGSFTVLPEGAHQDNIQEKQCKKCQQTINKLMAVGSTIVGKNLSDVEVLALLELLDKVRLNKKTMDKVRTPEMTVAVVGHPDGTKQTFTNEK